MKMITRNAVVAATALTLAGASVSQAVPTLRIMDGVNANLTIADQSGLDSSATVGQVNYSGAFNGWTILVSSGVTKPIVGSATSPRLDLTFQITRGAGSQGTITVCFSDTDFNLSTPRTFSTTAGGTLGNAGAPSVVVRSYYDVGNIALQQSTLLTSHTFLGQGGFSGNDSSPAVGPGNPVSFTIKIDLSEPIGGVASGNIDFHQNVPEGGSMVTFLGTGLLALGVLAARRKTVRA